MAGRRRATGHDAIDMHRLSLRSLLPFLAWLPLVLSGCFAGTVGAALGIAAAVDDGGSSPSEGPRIVSLRVLEGTPGSGRGDDLRAVRIAFDLIQAKGGSVRVLVERSIAGSTAPIAELELEGSSSGRPHVVDWDAAAEGHAGLQRADITVTPRDGAGRGFAAALRDLPLGNDPPRVTNLEVDGAAPTAAVGGNVVVRFELADSAPDAEAIELLVAAGDEPFRSVPPAHIPVGGLSALRPGRHALTWSSGATLGTADRSDVRIAIVPDDGLWRGRGAPAVWGPFRVDNNEPPRATVNGAAFVLSEDRTRGLPVPFRLEDAEGDDLLAVMQWRLASQAELPELPRERAAMEAALASADARRALQIASELPPRIEGRIEPTGAAAGQMLRLPELALAGLGAHEVIGRELEFLRVDAAIVAPGGADALATPVAAAALPDGSTVVVLERPSPGSHRLREIELAGGRERRRIVPANGGPAAHGNPTAMALEPGARMALAGLELGEVWWLVRIELASGATRVLADAGASLRLGAVQAIAPLSPGASLIIAGSSLLRIEHATGPGDARSPRVVPILDGLDEPRGLAVDPLRPEIAYLAQRGSGDGGGRVERLRLDTRERTELSLPGIGHPGSIALERSGARLLGLSEAADGERGALFAVELGRAGAGPSAAAAELPDGAASLALGPEGMRIVALPESDALLIAGGVAERRRICAYDPAGATVTLDEAIDSRSLRGAPWRLRRTVNGAACSPGRAPAPLLRSDIFTWDASDLPAGGEVLLRLTPFDAERGIPDDTGLPRGALAPLETAPVVLEGAGAAYALAAGDVDGDGDLDAVTANAGEALAVYSQSRVGVWGLQGALGEPGGCPALEPGVLLAGVAGAAPRALVIADLDGDSRADVAAADSGAHVVAVYSQQRDGQLGEPPSGDAARRPGALLGGPQASREPVSLAAADLDQDGDLDLASANRGTRDVTVFLLDGPPDSWSAAPGAVLARSQGDDGPLGGPIAVATGDFDGDGDIDLLAVHPEANDLALYLQEGGRLGLSDTSGRREPQRLLGGPAETRRPRAALLADLDGDGVHDIVCACQGDIDFEKSGVAVLRAPGGGGVQVSILWSDPAAIGDPSSLVSGDWDGDGAPDLGVASLAAGRIVVLLARREAAPAATLSFLPLLVAGPELTPSPRGLAAADFDGDARLDLGAADLGGTAVLFLARGSLRAACPRRPAVLLGNKAVTPRPSSFAAADLDGDGSIDLAVASPADESLTILAQTAPRRFEPRGPFALGSLGLVPSTARAADLDGDARVDLACASPTTDAVGLVLAPGTPANGGLRTARLVASTPTAAPRDVVAADFDQDGDLDLASAEAATGSIALYLQAERGSFGAARAGGERGPHVLLGGARLLTTPVTLAAADVDGDGRTDVLGALRGVDPEAADAEGSGVAVYYQAGDGRFGTAPAEILGGPRETPGAQALRLADLELDGDLDLLVPCYAGALAVFLQSEPRRFALLRDGPLLLDSRGFTLGPLAVGAGDLDGDGDADLVSGNDFGNDLAVFLAPSPGRFAPVPDFSLADREGTKGPAWLEVLDLDGDADLDVVAAASRADGIAVFHGGDAP